MKNYYFNENAFLQEQSPDVLAEKLYAFKTLYDATEQYRGRLCIKDTFQYNELRRGIRQNDCWKYAIPFQLFGKCNGIVTENCERHAVERINPDISSEVIRELIAVCNRDGNERMVSLPQDREAVADEYQLKHASVERVFNFTSAAKIADYSLNHPYPNNIKEVFQRVEENFPDIHFMEKSFKTAAKRESAYRKVGYEELLNVFKIMNERLLPFYRNETQGKSENDIFREIREAYNVDISTETKKTMDLYGQQREVLIDGTIYAMKNHIKFNKDACRIHFKYIESKDKIYIGHSGKHLDTAEG